MISAIEAKKLYPKIKSFEQHLRDKGYSESTVKNYISLLKILLKTLDLFSGYDIKQYLNKLKSENRKFGYINSFIFVSKKFTRFLIDSDLKADATILKIHQLQYGHKPSTGSLSKNEVENFLTVPPPENYSVGSETTKKKKKINPKVHRKWTNFFLLMCYSGLSPGEVSHIRKSDFDFNLATVSSSFSKTLQNRQIPIPKWLSDYFSKETTLLSSSMFVFGRSTNKLTPEMAVNWGYNFHRRLNSIGITNDQAKKRNLTPLSLRRFYIEEIIKNNVNLLSVQILAGHSQITSTNYYAEKLCNKPSFNSEMIEKAFG